MSVKVVHIIITSSAMPTARFLESLYGLTEHREVDKRHDGKMLMFKGIFRFATELPRT